MNSLRLIILVFFISTFLGCKQQDTFKFEKIVFHTSSCFGPCPIYHLEIDKNKKMRLHSELAYHEDKNRNRFIDSTKMGYFVGLVNDTSFNSLINILQMSGIDTLNFGHTTCCDGSLITMIVYHDGKRKYFQSMFPPKKVHDLLSLLREICAKNNLKSTNKKFMLEAEEDIVPPSMRPNLSEDKN